MKSKITLWSVAIFLGFNLFVFSSCKKEDQTPAPTITLKKLGTHAEPQSKMFHLDEGGHFEADISAPGLVKKIELQINQVSGYATYSYKEEFTGDYVGRNEVESFHSHPVIPSGAPIGDYIFKIIVTDQLGQVGFVESELQVMSSDDPTHVHEP